MGEGKGEGRSLEQTPTWTVATVITVMVLIVLIFHSSMKHFGKVKYSFILVLGLFLDLEF